MDRWKQNWGLRLIALAMAILVWFYVRSRS
jgi:YbbR domain-containing protein